VGEIPTGPGESGNERFKIHRFGMILSRAVGIDKHGPTGVKTVDLAVVVAIDNRTATNRVDLKRRLVVGPMPTANILVGNVLASDTLPEKLPPVSGTAPTSDAVCVCEANSASVCLTTSGLPKSNRLRQDVA